MPSRCPRPRAERLRPLWASALLVLSLACPDPETPPPPPPEVPVVEVVRRDQPIAMEMVGQTLGSADIPIRARVEGVLTGIHFVEGRQVEADQLLYTIDPSPFEARVVEAQGYVAEARTMLAKARSDLDRIRPLAEMRAVSQTDLDGARAQHDAAMGAVQAAQARLEQARIELGYTRIHAPIGGRIGISKAKVGEFVGREPNPVVLNFVSKTDPIRVRFSIDERRYLQLARRLREIERDPEESRREPGLELILADGTVHEHRGHVNATDAAVDPDTGSFSLEADFPNPDEVVLAGQFARVRAIAETRRDALLVPQRAIRELQGMFRVYVVGEDGAVEMRPVELGPKVDRLQVVESGLEGDERVALEVMRLRPGVVVEARRVEIDATGAPVEPDAPAAVPPAAEEPGGGAGA